MSKTNKTDFPRHRETLLKSRLRDEIEAGLAASEDPKNAGLPDLYLRQTTMYSLWYTRTCPECKHKFREGDMVRICPRCGRVYHDDDQHQLHCWQEHFAAGGACQEVGIDPITDQPRVTCDYTWPGDFPDESQAGRETAPPTSTQRIPYVTEQFMNGLETFWTPYGEENVLEVPRGSQIVGHECPWCRFQIRAGDRVVKCPCGKCNTYFHNDIFRHLTCWNEWHGSEGNDYCPTTSAKIERERSADDAATRFTQTDGDNER
jgi:hypothetical protein